MKQPLHINTGRRESTDIMIMGMIRNDEIRWAIENGIEFYLFEKDRLESAIEAAIGDWVKEHASTCR